MAFYGKAVLVLYVFKGSSRGNSPFLEFLYEKTFALPKRIKFIKQGAEALLLLRYLKIRLTINVIQPRPKNTPKQAAALLRKFLVPIRFLSIKK